MERLVLASFACVLLWPASTGGREKDAPPLTSEHRNASSTFTLSSPGGWTSESRRGVPEVTELRGDGLLVRAVRRDAELGLDSLHVECMLMRLAPPMVTSPQVEYEYDFVGSVVGERRSLDSAFVVHYDGPVDGHRDWRQRNLTIVGRGESLCLIGYAPIKVWKQSKRARILLTSVMASVRF